MNPDFDYRRFAILYVDDEEKSLRMFAEAFGQQFRILTAASAAEGRQLLAAHHHEIGVLMTDQRMPGERGVQLLEKARQSHPRVLRILTTAFTDLEAAIGAVNSGAIYKYVKKPWDPRELAHLLRQSLEFFLVQHERDELLREKISTLHRLMIADRIISLGVLSAGLSHHIRNSLVAVRTFLDLAPVKLAEEKVNPEALRDPQYWRGFYQQVQAQIQRITDLLGGLGMAADHASADAAESMRVEALLSESLDAASPALARKNLLLHLDCAPALPAIRGNAAKIRRLLDLLLEDEIISLPPGGEITLRLRPSPRSDGVQIELEDNGPGLSPEDMRSVFDPFFARSNNPQDLGINLMACYFIVYHHGGAIEVQSEPGRGTVFRIDLPSQPERPPEPLGGQAWMDKLSLHNELWEKLISGRA